MGSNSTARTPHFNVATARLDVIAGLVSSTVAIPLAMAFGMFAFVTLGDEYFAYGAMAGLVSAVIAGCICVLLGDRSTLCPAHYHHLLPGSAALFAAASRHQRRG